MPNKTAAPVQLMRLLTLAFLSLLTANLGLAQPDSTISTIGRKSLGLTVQVYPAGIITAANLELPLHLKGAAILRLGANLIDRQDFSPYNDDEKGGGFGATAGYHHYFPLRVGKIIVGLNTDLWNVWINWKDEVGTVAETEGRSYTLVVQPWLEVGYAIDLKRTPLQIGLTAAFGREINVITVGEEVGQGWMNSGLLYLRYKL